MSTAPPPTLSPKPEIALPRNAWYAPGSFDLARRIVRLFPRRFTRAFAGAVGRLGYRVCRSRREALLGNLAALIPDPKTQEKLGRASFENFLCMLHDFVAAAESREPLLNNLVVERRGFDSLAAGQKNGRGTLLITGHIGAWELGGMVLAEVGFPVNVVTIHEPTPQLDAWRQKFRSRFGIKTITIGSDKFAFIEIVQALRRNELVAMLIDRPYLNSGVNVRFFDRTTQFSTAAARLWSVTGATVVPAFALQLQPGRYGCYAYPPIDLVKGGSLEENSQKMADVFQAIIREFPDQWFNFVPVWE